MELSAAFLKKKYIRPPELNTGRKASDRIGPAGAIGCLLYCGAGIGTAALGPIRVGPLLSQTPQCSIDQREQLGPCPLAWHAAVQPSSPVADSRHFVKMHLLRGAI